ncbi:MAG: hypothetical protein WAN14_20180 [Candidatus Acidiferrales bacterium]
MVVSPTNLARRLSDASLSIVPPMQYTVHPILAAYQKCKIGEVAHITREAVRKGKRAAKGFCSGALQCAIFVAAQDDDGGPKLRGRITLLTFSADSSQHSIKK